MSENDKPKLNTSDLANKLKASYKAKKRDESIVGTGEDLPLPKFWIKAPAPIDRLLARVGYGTSKIYQIAGRPNSGKTTLAMMAMIQAQKDGFYVILVDTEKKFSIERYEKMGGSPKDINAIFPANLEEAFVAIDEHTNLILAYDSEARILIVFDSLGGTPSQAETEADADQSIQLATAAKVIGRFLRIFVQKLYRSNITLLFINQVYANIGSHGYSNKGGDSPEFFSSAIMQLTRTGDYTRVVKGEKVNDGIYVKAKITKNHLRQGVEPQFVTFRVRPYSIEDMTDGVGDKNDDQDSDDS